MHCEAWRPKVHDQWVADYSERVAHCKDYQCKLDLANLIQKGSVIKAENIADGLEQLEGCYGHHDDSNEVEESLSGEFNADRDSFIEGDKTLTGHHKEEKRDKKVVKHFLFPLYAVKPQDPPRGDPIRCYSKLHFLEFKGNLGQNLGMANS